MSSSESLLQNKSHHSSKQSLTRSISPLIIPGRKIERSEKLLQLLNQYEADEIKAYPEIYYIGIGVPKILPSYNGASKNNGYDNDEGRYKLALHDHLAYRYEILSFIGCGTFAIVVKAYDRKYRCNVAIKIVNNQHGYAKMAMAEIGMYVIATLITILLLCSSGLQKPC